MTNEQLLAMIWPWLTRLGRAQSALEEFIELTDDETDKELLENINADLAVINHAMSMAQFALTGQTPPASFTDH